MTELVVLERHQTFLVASNRARALAMDYKKQTALRRNGDGWEVLVPLSLRQLVRVGHHEDGCELEEVDDDYERERDNYLIVGEMMDDQESWARSGEDGWYYADET